MIELFEHQEVAVAQMRNGCVAWGPVGSGKTVCALEYYVRNESPKPIVVITTARKRDDLDWIREASLFGIGQDPGVGKHGPIIVDSWNNIGKYVDYDDCFFVFDEQRLVGSGAWMKAAIKITKRNNWIMLSATPGDNWMDYMPLFVANGWYKNKTDFTRQHVVYRPYVKFPQVDHYINTEKLEKLKARLLVEVPYKSPNDKVMNYIEVGYDSHLYERVRKLRRDPFTDEPFRDAAEMFRMLRFIVNSDGSRLEEVVRLLNAHKRLIIFYNFDYELEILRLLHSATTVGEWNGHRKDPVPDTDDWVYLVQYAAGAEAWECTSTDATVFWSLPYSYKFFTQAQGRIDRLNTPYDTLYYYVLVSNSRFDRGIRQSLSEKHDFNERRFGESEYGIEEWL